MIAPIGETEEQDGVMATRPATTPEAAPSEVGWPSRNALGEQPAQGRGGGRDQGVHPDDGGGVAGGDGGAGVEAEPAEPQQAGAEHDQGEVVRPHRVAPPAEPLAKHDGEGQTGDTGVDVHRGATGEVDRLQVVGDPAADVGDTSSVRVKSKTQWATGK